MVWVGMTYSSVLAVVFGYDSFVGIPYDSEPVILKFKPSRFISEVMMPKAILFMKTSE